MDKLKSMLHGKDKSSESTSSHSAPASGGNPDNAQGVILHTTLGDIKISLYSRETPRVRLHHLTPS
jgi:peptidyl-prolyl cis-trans isomerase-like 1